LRFSLPWDLSSRSRHVRRCIQRLGYGLHRQILPGQAQTILGLFDDFGNTHTRGLHIPQVDKESPSDFAGCVHQLTPATARLQGFSSKLPDFRPLIRFICRTGRSEGDDTTEQITYSRQEAEALVDRWSDTVLRVAYTWTGNPEDAQDVCQTVLLKLLTRPERFAEPDRERAWVLRVAINCCKDLKKSAWTRKRVSLDAAAEAAVFLQEPGESPVLEAIQALPGKYREAMYLRYYEEYDVSEIAALMGCRKNQVSTYLYRAKAKLRTMLGGSYGQEYLPD